MATTYTTVNVALYCSKLSTATINVPLEFDQLRRGLQTLEDKTAYELVRLTRKRTTKERFMKLLNAYIEEYYGAIPDMNEMAWIVQVITTKFLKENEEWL